MQDYVTACKLMELISSNDDQCFVTDNFQVDHRHTHTLGQMIALEDQFKNRGLDFRDDNKNTKITWANHHSLMYLQSSPVRFKRSEVVKVKY